MNNEFVLVPVLGVKVWVVVMIVIIVLLIAALVALSIYGRKLQKRQESTQKEIEAAAQNVLIVDKKRMKLKESGLPQLVIDQTPKYLRGQKVPIVKAKVGPKIMTLICDEKIFELIPVKKSVRATVSGIYITKVQGLRTNLEAKPKKVKFSQKIKNKFSKDK